MDPLRSRQKDFIRKEKEFCKDTGDVKADKSLHKFRESLFSSSFSRMNNWGISNVCLIVLIISNVCLALENISKFGIFINPLLWLKIYFIKLTEMSSIYILSGLNIFVLSSLGLEVLLSKGILNNEAIFTLVSLLLTCEISVPFFVLHAIDSFSVAFTILLCYVAVFLKLISYHVMNYWCRQKIITEPFQDSGLINQNRHKDFECRNNLVQYPDNLNVKDIYYFIFAPTLCYELNFPLLPHVRKSYLFKRILELFFMPLLIFSMIQQLIMPVVFHYQDSFQTLDYIKIFEIYMKLTLSFYTVWLLCFYFFFHSWLNAIGEILKFGDRFFYDDWWNAESIDIWWRKWNVPVRNWCLRHIYKPLLHSGFTKFQAVGAVFFVSAVFHEYLASLSLKIFKLAVFMGVFFGRMICFAFPDRPSNSNNIACCLNWLLFQPLLLLYYYYGYYVENTQNLKVNP